MIKEAAGNSYAKRQSAMPLAGLKGRMGRWKS